MQGVSHLHLTLLAQNIHWQAHLVGGQRVGAGPAADRVTVDANCGPVPFSPPKTRYVQRGYVGMRMSKASTIETQTGTAVVLEETLLRIDLNRYA